MLNVLLLLVTILILFDIYENVKTEIELKKAFEKELELKSKEK